MKEQSSSFRSRTTVFLAAVYFVCAAGLFSPMTHGATITVTSLADSGPGTLREAINTANGNSEDDTIEFSVTGTITLATTLPTITTMVDINGPGADQLTISGANTVRILLIGGTGIVNMFNLTIANGVADSVGGAIVVLDDALFLAQFCVFKDNTAASNGGAIFVVTTKGVVIVDCHFVGNTSGGNGGALDVFQADTEVIVAESLFENNKCTVGDGGAFSTQAHADVASSTFTGNIADRDGGAINTEAGAGGAAVHVTNCTIVNNSAENGGGIHGDTLLEFANSIVYNNNATTMSPDINGTTKSIGGNIVGDTSGWSNTPHASDLIGVDPLLGPLADNGGPTKTFLPHPINSPAVDAGDNSLVSALSFLIAHTLDQRLEARVFNSTVDIGAVEVQPGDPVPTPVSGTVAMIITTLLLTLCAGLVLATKGKPHAEKAPAP